MSGKHQFYNYNYNNDVKYTPNRNKSNSKYGNNSQFDYSNEQFPWMLNESNGEKLKDISDENSLITKFNNEEKSILVYCTYYISLKSIFEDADVKIKNKLLDYVQRFNNKCKEYSNIITNNKFEVLKKNEIENKLKKELNQKIEDYNNLVDKFKKEKKEFIDNNNNNIKELNGKLRNAEKEIKNLKKENESLSNKLKETEKKICYLNEKLNNVKQVSSPDYIDLSYTLGDQPDDITINNVNINIDCPHTIEFKTFSEIFKKAEKNFNTYMSLLIGTSNKTLNKFKEIYFKIKGKKWMESNNPLIKVFYSETFNINSEINWANIMQIHETIDNIIKEIFELVNPTKNCDPKKLNEDSCEFLLNYIIGLKKLFFLQKEILDNSFNNNNDDNYENKNKNLINFQNITNEAEKFFDKNNKILSNQTYYEKFKDELNLENTKILSVDEYIKSIKTVLIQARKIAEKKENELNDYKNNLNVQNSNYEDINIEISNSKNIRNNNGM